MSSASTSIKILRSDSKGRVCLGPMIPKGVTSFRAHVDKNHRIILEPLVEVPMKELLMHKKVTPSASKKSFKK